MELSDDPSAKQNQGNLGWFTKGAMVKEFEEAVFNTNAGEVIGPVKTNYGFHIIKVAAKEKKEFKIAQITKTVLPSSRSKQLVKNKADDFYSDLDKGQVMDSLAKQMNLQVQETPDITRDGPIPGAGQNKNLLKLIFDSEVRSNTEPVKVQGGYAIYQVIQKNPEGYQNFDSVKVTLIKPKVINEKKYQILSGIANDLQGKIKDGNLLSLKEAVPQYMFEVADSFSVAKPNRSIGQDFALSEAVLKMRPGEVSKPLKGTRGYYIVKLNSITEFNEQDYISKATDIKNNLLSTKKQQISSIPNLKLLTSVKVKFFPGEDSHDLLNLPRPFV